MELNAMNDLNTLRPEVREAVHAINHGNGVFVDSDDSIGAEKWRIVLTELLRLADECDELHTAYTSASQSRDYWKERAERAEAELAESRETIKRLNRRAQVAEAGVVEKVKEHAGGSLGRALANAAADTFMHERDEAQAELAALKARILPGTAKVEIADTDSPDGDPYGWVGGTLLSHDLIGKRVRLVVDEPAERGEG